MGEANSARRAPLPQAYDGDFGAEVPAAPRRWVLRLVTFWVVAAVAVAVLPTVVQLTYAFSRYPDPFGGNSYNFMAGMLAWFLIVTVPIGAGVGLLLGLASAGCVAAIGLWGQHSRRWRWALYLGSLFFAYAVVIVVVAMLAPTAVQPVMCYAVCAALIAAGSCLYLRRLERRNRLRPRV